MAVVTVGKKALDVSKSLDEEVLKLAPKKRVKEVLDEDTFAEDVEKIIQRDYFPDLAKLQAQSDFVEAQEKNDREKMRSLMIKYGPKRQRPGTDKSVYFTPSTFETPELDLRKSPTSKSQPEDNDIDSALKKSDLEETHNPEKVPERDKDDERVSKSLDAYLAKNTSEDNASFEEILQENALAHQAKHGWLYEQEKEKDMDQQAALALPSIEQQAITTGSNPLNSWKYTSRNALMYVPDGVEKSVVEKIQEQKAKRREIVRQNTRFKQNPFNIALNKTSIASAAAAQAIARQGKLGVDGKEVLPDTEPRVNGFGFMGTPSPAPGVDASPLMTWGEIDGTPFRLDGTDSPVVHTPGPTFRIPKIPKRDQIAFDLAEKASKAHRAKKERAIKTVTAGLASPSPKFGSVSSTERLKTLSPAAQRLASSKLGIRTHTDKALRASYTPSPTHRSGDRTPSLKGTPTPTSSRSTRTPRNLVSPKTTPKRTSDLSSLTDNLLNLPTKQAKRQKAADFF
ncbi:splicing factor ESS-2 homolog [Lineus longissimus]|uniref:splicing factor ESS-2 homolog n=1 Tax=Lineus longissimus TaxID=88925 RepID=UPI002B4F858F